MNRRKKRVNVHIRALKSRKAADQWISWVLLMGFTVVLSAFMYRFMVDYTKDSTQDVKKVVYNADECRMVSLTVDSACLASQALNMTLENKNYIRIDKMDIRLYNNRVPLLVNQTNITMNPNRVKVVSINVGVSAANYVEIIPHVEKENMDIICADKKAASDVVPC